MPEKQFDEQYGPEDEHYVNQSSSMSTGIRKGDTSASGYKRSSGEGDKSYSPVNKKMVQASFIDADAHLRSNAPEKDSIVKEIRQRRQT
jgi:hypothetical protein